MGIQLWPLMMCELLAGEGTANIRLPLIDRLFTRAPLTKVLGSLPERLLETAIQPFQVSP